MYRKKLFSLIIAAILLAVCLTACNSDKKPVDNTGSKPTEALTTQETPTPTVSVQDKESMRFVSEHTALLSASKTLLTEGSIDEQSFSLNGEGVFFDIENDMLNAYSEAIIHDESGNVRYELINPTKSFPGELGLRARKSVSNAIRANLNAEFDGDEDLQLFGYIGERYIIFTDEPFHGYQAAAIFVESDMGEWKEIPVPEGYSKQITGGCMIDERMGYLCCLDRDLMHSDTYTPRQLTVYRTADGGKTWENIELWIPEEYEGVIAPPAFAMSPFFEDEHGIILVTYSVYNEPTDSFDSKTAWFESTDGGTTWEFHIG